MSRAPGAIVSDRLDMLPLTPEDADEMVGVLADARLYVFIGGRPPTLEELRDRYRRLTVGHSADGLEEWRNWILRVRDDGRAIGTVQATIVDNRRTASIAWVVGVPWQGRGFATEAAQALVRWLEARGVVSINASIHPEHAASAAVAMHSGLDPTDEVVDGERVWRRPQPKRNPESPASTDESR